MRKRILSFLLCVSLIFSCLIPPAYALPNIDVNVDVDVVDFFDWIIDTGVDFGNSIQSIFNESVCPYSPADGTSRRHNFVKQHTMVDGKTGLFYICEYCGRSAGEVGAETYDNYVDDIQDVLGTVEVGSGGYVLPLPIEGVRVNSGYMKYGDFTPGYPFSVTFYKTYTDAGGLDVFPDSTIVAPVSGTYYLCFSGTCSGVSNKIKERSSGVPKYAGESFLYNGSTRVACLLPSRVNAICYVSGYFYYFIVPVSYDVNDFTADIGGINSRPTSITGGNYGIVGDDGTINTVTNNSTIVNETNNTYYNPATGETKSIQDWSYDYGDRTYTITVEGGETYTVTYGDENISITENNVVEGDTTVNNYTIYYMIDGSGTGGETHTHEWYQTGAVQGNCLTPAQRTYTCSVCYEHYTETDPVLGHVWMTKQTVPTQYDDEGNLIQEGYIIYECNRCGELYTSTGGVDPPSGGGSSSPGTSICPHNWKEILRIESTCTLSGQIVFSCSECGSTRSETLKARGHTWQILQSVQSAYDEEGNLVQQGYTIYQCSFCGEQYKDADSTGPPDGSVNDGGLIEWLNGLIKSLSDNLSGAVELIISFFENIPKLFGGFLDFLSAMFPYLPDEIIFLFTFGLAALVIIGIIKAIRR